MSRADVSDPEIKKAIDAMKSSSSLKSWVLLGYVPKSDTKIKVEATGDDGLSEVVEYLNDGKVFYALVSYPVNNIRKVVYVSWCGEGVTGMKKGLFNNHANDVGFLFKGFHLQINARNEDDLDEGPILEKLKKATGASYDSGAKNQGTASLVPTSVSQGKVQATQSNAKFKTADKTDYNKKDESDEYWVKKREEENQAKVAAQARPRDEYNKTAERNQFWQQQQQAPAPAPAPQRSAAPVPGGNANNLKSRFEQAAQQQVAPPPARVAPPPARAAPKPAAPAPVHHYEEPAAETPAEDEWGTQQEQHHYEEPAQEYHEETSHYDENAQYQEQDYSQQSEWTDDQQQAQEYYEEQPAETYDDQSQYQQEDQSQYYDESATQEQTQEYYEDQSAATGSTCRALYDYDGENADDLVFKENDVINVLDKSDPSGWWQGELNGAVGYFPSNFVEEM